MSASSRRLPLSPKPGATRRTTPSFTQHVVGELSKRLRNASNRIESLATMDVYGRLARFFLDLARQSGKVLENDYVAVIRPTHQAIANMIGTSRETVSRLIHDLMK